MDALVDERRRATVQVGILESPTNAEGHEPSLDYQLELDLRPGKCPPFFKRNTVVTTSQIIEAPTIKARSQRSQG